MKLICPHCKLEMEPLPGIEEEIAPGIVGICAVCTQFFEVDESLCAVAASDQAIATIPAPLMNFVTAIRAAGYPSAPIFPDPIIRTLQ